MTRLGGLSEQRCSRLNSPKTSNPSRQPHAPGGSHLAELGTDRMRRVQGSPGGFMTDGDRSLWRVGSRMESCLNLNAGSL